MPVFFLFICRQGLQYVFITVHFLYLRQFSKQNICKWVKAVQQNENGCKPTVKEIMRPDMLQFMT